MMRVMQRLSNRYRPIYNITEKWLLARTLRERFFLFLVSLAVIYLFWVIFISHSLTKKRNELASRLAAVKTEMLAVQQKEALILQIVSNGAYDKKFIEYQKLASQSDEVRQKATQLKPVLVAKADFPKVIKDILSVRQGITLVSLKDFPDEEWIPAELNIASAPSSLKNIYKHILQIEFQGDYNNTITYLRRLESLPWRIYWDTMEYRVTQYPAATVVLKLYTLSDQKSGI